MKYFIYMHGSSRTFDYTLTKRLVYYNIEVGNIIISVKTNEFLRYPNGSCARLYSDIASNNLVYPVSISGYAREHSRVFGRASLSTPRRRSSQNDLATLIAEQRTAGITLKSYVCICLIKHHYTLACILSDIGVTFI